MKFLRVKPGHGEILLAEGDVELEEDERALIEEFRRQLDQGMWAAVPTTGRVSGSPAPAGTGRVTVSGWSADMPCLPRG